MRDLIPSRMTTEPPGGEPDRVPTRMTPAGQSEAGLAEEVGRTLEDLAFAEEYLSDVSPSHEQSVTQAANLIRRLSLDKALRDGRLAPNDLEQSLQECREQGNAEAREAEYWRRKTEGGPGPASLSEQDEIEGLWQDLLDKDDRTSPEEYPDMALITFDEFRAALASRDAPPPGQGDGENAGSCWQSGTTSDAYTDPHGVVGSQTYTADLSDAFRERDEARNENASLRQDLERLSHRVIAADAEITDAQTCIQELEQSLAECREQRDAEGREAEYWRAKATAKRVTPRESSLLTAIKEKVSDLETYERMTDIGRPIAEAAPSEPHGDDPVSEYMRDYADGHPLNAFRSVHWAPGKYGYKQEATVFQNDESIVEVCQRQDGKFDLIVHQKVGGNTNRWEDQTAWGLEARHLMSLALLAAETRPAPSEPASPRPKITPAEVFDELKAIRDRSASPAPEAGLAEARKALEAIYTVVLNDPARGIGHKVWEIVKHFKPSTPSQPASTGE